MGDTVIVEFAAPRVAVHENDPLASVHVIRSTGKGTVTVDYQTKDGTAVAGVKYEAAQGTVTFKDGETKATIQLKVIDDDIVGEDKEFSVELSNPLLGPPRSPSGSRSPRGGKSVPTKAELGKNPTCAVLILDDDHPGLLGVLPENVLTTCQESDGKVNVTVSRMRGQCGGLRCKISTKDVTATAGVDYEALSETLEFKPDEIEKKVEITLIDDGLYDIDEKFEFVISGVEVIDSYAKDAEELAAMKKLAGAAEITVGVVNIVSDEEQRKFVERVTKLVNEATDEFNTGASTYKEQFDELLAGPEGGLLSSGGVAWIITLPFNAMFTLIPPACQGGGIPCFVVSIAMIGLITACIADLAGLLGCVVGLDDSVTAITLVALGTSLPDTFASRSAAISDSNADASIGNVTGSNAVNVFLGLGLPWFMGALYWGSLTDANAEWKERYTDQGAVKATDIVITCTGGAKACFAVPAGGLAFSVTVFTCCAIACFVTLYLRRTYLGAELGGDPKMARFTGSFLIFLWLLYIVLSIVAAPK